MKDLTPSSSIDLIESLLHASDTLVVKKLSNNDRRWADDAKHGHQNGPYIPSDIQSSGFFPRLENINPARPHILEASITTHWIRLGESKQSRIVHYSNKGRECHFTRVPRDEFSGISPSSWLLMARPAPPADAYRCLVIDSADEEGAAFVEAFFDIQSDFESGVFNADDLRRSQHPSASFVDELFEALTSGTLESLLKDVSFPPTAKLAKAAQDEYFRITGETDLNPFRLECPGDTLMRLSRDIEHKLFKEYTTRYYSAKLMLALSGGEAKPDLKSIVRHLVEGFEEIYKEVMVSAGQRSKSRAGYSFEHHVHRMLTDGGIPFEAQKILGNQRPDFILPSMEIYRESGRDYDEAFILSLKTLLRERWKQVLSENKTSDLFLATVDDSITSDSITEMATQKIFLVVPETLKDSRFTEYNGHENVITFRDFFTTELSRRQTLWTARGMSVPFNR